MRVHTGEAGSGGAALYVDTENLREADHAQDAIAQAVADWPGPLPLSSLSLYVRADKVAVWEMWAEEAYPDLQVRVRGVQHFSNNKAKNSADLAITADAVADLVTGQAAAVAVVSNDSDFGALFVKVRELAQASGRQQTPFLWVTSPDAGALSPEMERFIPAGLRWDLSAASLPAPKSLPAAAQPIAQPTTPSADKTGDISDIESVAEELIRQLPVGRFKAAEAQQVIKRRWPKRPVANADTAKFGQYLGKKVWPILQRHGVTMPRKSSPRTYEITQAAKESIGKAPNAKPPAQVKGRGKTAAEPAPVQLAAAVASAITDDLFSASDALNAVKAAWPTHSAAGMTPQRFGLWFSEQLWPVMEQQGVVLAKEKPRRYEMTPDARHRLTTLAQD